jgi:hypothetical protein
MLWGGRKTSKGTKSVQKVGPLGLRGRIKNSPKYEKPDPIDR